MSISARGAPKHLAAEAAVVVLAALAVFAVVGGMLAVSRSPLVVLVLAVFCGAVVVRTAHAGADVYAAPLALAAVLAFDFFYRLPLGGLSSTDLPNRGALVGGLVAIVLVSTISARTRRRVTTVDRSNILLIDEQAALRRVATLVAQESASTEVFAAVAREVGQLMAVDATRIFRYEVDGTATVIAGWSPDLPLATGDRVPVEGQNLAAVVSRTRLPARVDSYSEATGPIAAAMREAGFRSSIGCPITVGGRLWGAMVAMTSHSDPIPVGAENRLAEFTELLATAISNTQARAELTASRARLVGAADGARRRIERDLHDGVQQRLVSLALDTRRLDATLPDDLEDAHTQLAELTAGLTGALDELREIARGIHPAILSEGGVEPALKALARRSAIPTQVHGQTDGRLPERIEVAIYYVVSEALTNAAKHSQASVVRVDVGQGHGCVRLAVSDDGLGGADAARGSGLVGLADRVDAVGGTIDITSPPGKGTLLVVTFPTDGT